MNVFRRIVSNQPLALVPGRYCLQDRSALSMVSCTRSSAWLASPVSRSATRYSASRWGSASSSNGRPGAEDSAISECKLVHHGGTEKTEGCTECAGMNQEMAHHGDTENAKVARSG